MNESQLKAAAFLLAEKTPPHLGISAYPPQRWIEVEPGIIRVLMADGRSIRASLADLVPPPVSKRAAVVETVHTVPSSLRDVPSPIPKSTPPVHKQVVTPAIAPAPGVSVAPKLVSLPVHAGRKSAGRPK